MTRFSKADTARLFKLIDKEFPEHDAYVVSLALATGVLYAYHTMYEELDTDTYTEKMNTTCRVFLGSIVDSLAATIAGTFLTPDGDIPPEKLN